MDGLASGTVFDRERTFEALCLRHADALRALSPRNRRRALAQDGKKDAEALATAW
jgi:phosphohistidine phosphatase SixA